MPLFSTSRAVKAYQMDLSSSVRRSMATGGGGSSVGAQDPLPGSRRLRRPRGRARRQRHLLGRAPGLPNESTEPTGSAPPPTAPTPRGAQPGRGSVTLCQLGVGIGSVLGVLPREIPSRPRTAASSAGIRMRSFPTQPLERFQPRSARDHSHQGRRAAIQPTAAHPGYAHSSPTETSSPQTPRVDPKNNAPDGCEPAPAFGLQLDSAVFSDPTVPSALALPAESRAGARGRGSKPRSPSPAPRGAGGICRRIFLY